MHVQWYAHLPGVALEGSDGFPIGLGRLEHLSFSDWSRLDDAFPGNDQDYERSRPVFYTGEADLPDDWDWNLILEQVSGWVYQLYLAFLLSPETPLLPAPQMSVIYVRVELSDDATAQALVSSIIGPFEREWIVFGSRISVRFDNTRLSAVQGAYDLLVASDLGSAFSGVEAGLHTLALTAHPEFWWEDRGLNWVNGFVHCIAALEHILLPPKDEAPTGMRLTPTFGRHAAVFTSPSRDDLHERTRTFSQLYRLRSRLIHGEIGIAGLSDKEWGQLSLGRRLLCGVILQAIALGQTASGGGSLPMLLAQAYENADAHQSLFDRLEEVQQK
jgi:hypothetical protein